MIRILFVESQPAATAALRERLSPLARLWQMCFVSDGATALQGLLSQPFDVVVTDPRLPDTDVSRFLATLQAQRPELLRYVWTADTRRLGTLSTMAFAHQVLPKSLSLEQLRGVVERGHALQQRLRTPAVRAALSRLKSLPALPQCYQRLSQALDNPMSGSAEVAAILEQDVGMTARILQMANSAFFAGARRISNVRDAVTKLGMLPLRSVVLSLDLFRSTAAADLPKGFSLDELQQHSMNVGQAAAAMFETSEERQCALSAGMLHDVGYLIFAAGLPQEWGAARARALHERRPLADVETELFGCSHAEIGGSLLALWGLPNSIIEAVTYHHRPAASGQKDFGVVAAVHAANALVHAGPRPLAECHEVHIDEDFLVRTGAMARIKQAQSAHAASPSTSRPPVAAAAVSGSHHGH